MMTNRVDPLGLDLTDFTPKKPKPKVSAEDIRKVAEQASFPSREPDAVKPPPPPVAPAKTERRQYRTGRNIQFSCKVSQEIEDEIYRLTDELERRMAEQVPGARWTVGMTIERMVAALRRELSSEQEAAGTL